MAFFFFLFFYWAGVSYGRVMGVASVAFRPQLPSYTQRKTFHAGDRPFCVPRPESKAQIS
jgi:hypothetical protein